MLEWAEENAGEVMVITSHQAERAARRAIREHEQAERAAHRQRKTEPRPRLARTAQASVPF